MSPCCALRYERVHGIDEGHRLLNIVREFNVVTVSIDPLQPDDAARLMLDTSNAYRRQAPRRLALPYRQQDRSSNWRRRGFRYAWYPEIQSMRMPAHHAG